MDPNDERDFHHPYKPYDIQLQFMSNLYDCLDQGQIGIFESPTGTGKSLSIICGALTWLRDFQSAELAGGAEADDDDEPAWVVEHAKNERIKRALTAKQELEARLAQIRNKERQQKKRFERGEPPPKRTKTDISVDREASDEEDAFALDYYDSDSEAANAEPSSSDGLSAATVKLLERAGMVLKSESQGEEALDVGTKIFFCSRTHSQLTQFANEVRRVKFPPVVFDLDEDDGKVEDVEESIKLLSLGARKNFCINPRVSKLGGATAINERCLELQQPKTPKEQKCAFVPTKETETLVHDFRDHALAEIRDIEDLGRIGKQIGICPYYASRATIKPSEIVTLPYPLLLQKSAREALGISLKGHVVIIDEAHNLMNAIEGIYSVSLTLSQLTESRTQLTTYLQKFRNKLKGKNRVYVIQVVRLIDSLIGYLNINGSQTSKNGTINMTDLLSGKGVDQINLHKLCHYLHESKLARKVAGYTTFTNEAEAAAKQASQPRSNQTAPKQKLIEQQQDMGSPAPPVLMLIESFFQALANPAAEGRFFYERDPATNVTRLKYMLLDPSEAFRPIVESARAVILAGGTMSPTSDYLQHLFPYLPAEKTRTLSCGHVIPKENLLAAPITSYNGVELEFTFGKRNTPAVLDALGQAALRLAQTVPGGVVVFFPSYAYLEGVLTHWKKGSTFSDLNSTKPVLSESQGANTDSLFASYASRVHAPDSPGALLLAVIGGKLSEGINFSNSLGRCVAVVGLPFPNVNSPEWSTKLEYIQNSAIARGQSVAEGKALEREYYENACMRAVNQSIGRAIRHKTDWAAIVLLDKRYAGERIRKKLPGWIMEGLVRGAEGSASEREVWRKLEEFYAGKKQ